MIKTFLLILAIILEQVGFASLIYVDTPTISASYRVSGNVSFLDRIHPEPKATKEVDSSTITARSFVAIDKNNNTVLAEKSSDISVPMASLTKIMTAILVIENVNLDEELVVSKNAVSAYGEGIDLRAGEHLKVSDVLYAALLSSSNDACIALGEHVSGSEEKFVELMNRKAKEIGLSKTHFTNASGLDDPQHFSNVFDLARLTRYGLYNDLFASVVSTKEKTIVSSEGITHRLRNTNALLGTLDGVLGVKTGLTGEAGECLITLTKRNDNEIILVLLGSEDRFGESKEIINKVFDAYKW